MTEAQRTKTTVTGELYHAFDTVKQHLVEQRPELDAFDLRVLRWLFGKLFEHELLQTKFEELARGDDVILTDTWASSVSDAIVRFADRLLVTPITDIYRYTALTKYSPLDVWLGTELLQEYSWRVQTKLGRLNPTAIDDHLIDHQQKIEAEMTKILEPMMVMPGHLLDRLAAYGNYIDTIPFHQLSKQVDSTHPQYEETVELIAITNAMVSLLHTWMYKQTK